MEGRAMIVLALSPSSDLFITVPSHSRLRIQAITAAQHPFRTSLR
jgi:hypothetical protein